MRKPHRPRREIYEFVSIVYTQYIFKIINKTQMHINNLSIKCFDMIFSANSIFFYVFMSF
jgi:hypothetical protein